jgi:hypothetical protein
MPIHHVHLKNWTAECPKCHNIEFSEAMRNKKCDNCGAPAIMTVGEVPGRAAYPNRGFETPEARQSWRQFQCSNNCGWSLNHVTCSQCGASIRGDWFKGDFVLSTVKLCFVATAVFNDQDHPTVERLRRIRDEQLTKSKPGIEFIRLYYRHGPILAAVVNRLSWLKPVLRVILNGLLKLFR